LALLHERTIQALVAGAMAVLVVLCWWWLLPMHMAPRRIPIDVAPVIFSGWTASKAWLLFIMWSVMMAAMMIPSAIPMVFAVQRISRTAPNSQSPGPETVFLLAYLLVWTGFSAVATGGQWLAERAGLMSDLMASANAWLSGGVLVGAGLFQFSPLKHACLGRCRSPMGFLMTEWRPGLRGTFVSGLKHAVYCLGCCWALMALLFVFGTMNLLAAVGLTVLVLAEKALPGGPLIARIAGVAFAGWGLWIIGQAVVGAGSGLWTGS
jgi:predicted metal-binding membrane protein